MRLPRPVTNFLIRTVGRAVLGLWSRSERVTVVGKEGYDRLRAGKKPVVLLVWHGRLFFAPHFFRHTGIVPLISPSRDGEALVQLAAGWGYRILRGSSSHSILKAWKEMKAELAGGGVLVIVPDGPRGPAGIVKSGAIAIAHGAGAAIVPAYVQPDRAWYFRSWDRFFIPKPFAKIKIYFYPKIILPPLKYKNDFEKQRKKLEDILRPHLWR